MKARSMAMGFHKPFSADKVGGGFLIFPQGTQFSIVSFSRTGNFMDKEEGRKNVITIRVYSRSTGEAAEYDLIVEWSALTFVACPWVHINTAPEYSLAPIKVPAASRWQKFMAVVRVYAAWRPWKRNQLALKS